MDKVRTVSPLDVSFSPRWMSFAAAAGPQDVDGIKTTIASNVAQQTYNAVGQFTGANGPRFFNGIGPACTVSVHNSASVGAYNFGAGNRITISGWYNGAIVTQQYQLATADGGENLILGAGGVPLQPFDKLDSIVIPAQVSGAGAWTIGIRELVCPSGGRFRWLRTPVGGNITLRYGEDPATDDVMVTANGESVNAAFSHIVATALAFSVGY